MSHPLAALAQDPLLHDLLVFFEGEPQPSSDRVNLPPLDHCDFEGWQIVARGPTLAETEQDDAHDVWIWSKVGDPERLFVGMNEFCPPGIFVPVTLEAKPLRELLKRFTRPSTGAPEAPLSSVELALGLVPTMREAENRFALDSFMHAMPLALGTAATDAIPSPEEQELLLTSVFLTRYSKSRITLEGWGDFLPGRILIARVEYEPADDRAVVRKYNQWASTQHPEELPLDVVGCLHRLLNLSAERLWASIEHDPEPAVAMLFASLLDFPRPRATLERLQPYLDHPELGAPAQDLVQWFEANLEG